MSLLNDVMRDLQTRGVLGVPPLAGLQPVSGVPQQQRRRSHLLPALLALTAVSALVIWTPLGGDGWQSSFARLAGLTPPANEAVSVDVEQNVAEVVPVVPATGNDLRELFPIDVNVEDRPLAIDKPVSESAPVTTAEPMTSVASAATEASVPVESAPVQTAVAEPREEPKIAETRTVVEVPTPAQTKPTILRRESGQQDVESIVARAMQAMRTNDLVAAERLLREALTIDPANVNSWSFLYGVLKTASRPAAAEQALQQGLALTDEPAPLAKLYARKLLDRGDKGAAIRVLDAHRPAAGLDTEYDAFLAALLQQAGQYEEAGEIYRNLLTIDPNSGAWLVGLAMSNDSLGYREEALFAFEQALASGSLTPPLDRYAQRRTVELTEYE
ncbi:MAG: tetratricopeptide repeat protein [Woeseiaceae bacterium]|nr:tetratricopeptide repeat protein [Woeseiaceae bacterium]